MCENEMTMHNSPSPAMMRVEDLQENEQSYVNGCMPVAPGAIIRLESYAASGGLYHLKGRPLIVLQSIPDFLMGGILCCTVGSQGNLPGIVCHLSNQVGKWMTDVDTSIIYPWTVQSINPTCISSVEGYLRPDILKAVLDAFAYHMGFSQTPPPYMEPYLYDVEYLVKSPWIDSRRPLSKDTMSKYPTYRHKPVARNAPEQVATNIIPPTLPPLEEVEERKVHQLGESSAEENQELLHKNTAPPHKKVSDVVQFEPHIDTKVKGTSGRVAALQESLDEDDIIEIISRVQKSDAAAKKYNISGRTYRNLRKKLEDKFVTAKNFRQMRDKLRGHESYVKFLSKLEKVILAIYGEPETTGLNPTALEKVKGTILKSFGIRIDNGKAWHGDIETRKAMLRATYLAESNTYASTRIIAEA